MEAQETGNATGRPPTFETPEALQVAVDAYFQHLDDCLEEPTVTGLTFYVGFASRSSWDDYAKRNKDFSYIVKRAKLRVEMAYEKGLRSSNPTGPIFALKQMGWADKSEIDHTTKGQAIGQADLSKYSDDDLRILAELQRKSGTSEA